MTIDFIWQNYRSHLYALLRSKIDNTADVEDLLQEILIKTHQHLGDLKTDQKLKPWLFTLAHNTVIDFYRKRGRQPKSETQDFEFWNEDDPVIEHAMADCIQPFIEALPSDTAALLKKIDIDGYSQKNYAAELGISYSTLKSRVQRGRTQLRKLFENCCELEMDRYGNIINYREVDGTCNRCD